MRMISAESHDDEGIRKGKNIHQLTEKRGYDHPEFAQQLVGINLPEAGPDACRFF